MSTVLQLSQLQKIDSRIDEANRRIREIDFTLSSNDQITAAIDALNSAEQLLAVKQRLQEEQEQEAEKIRIKIAQSNASLYGGKIKNPKELKDLQLEIASLQKHLLTIEDQILDTMMLVESCSEEAASKKTALRELQAKYLEINAGLNGERSMLESEIARLQQERKMLSAQIDPEWIAIYENLRSKKRGLALATTKDRSCGACGAILTPADWQSARAPGKLFYCPSCGRILYAG